MVTNVTSLTGNGLRDWLIQRLSAVFIGAYALFLMGFILMHPHMTYGQWSGLFDCVWMKIASVVLMFSVVLHAWIGLWTVFTDYVKCTIIRLSLHALVALLLVSLLVWGIFIFWG